MNLLRAARNYLDYTAMFMDSSAKGIQLYTNLEIAVNAYDETTVPITSSTEGG